VRANDYHFITRWRVRGTIDEVSDILSDPLDLARWWPSVYLAVKEIKPGDSKGLGREVELHTRGRLPYTLRWRFRTTESRRPYGFSLEAWGDFNGTGAWTFEQDADFVNITYDWKIRADKPLLRHLSFLLKPIFSANHRWAMARGEESLAAELGRRAGGGQQSAGHRS
jgi:polyketide cyclase/dehydrase/lipid transport protein